MFRSFFVFLCMFCWVCFSQPLWHLKNPKTGKYVHCELKLDGGRCWVNASVDDAMYFRQEVNESISSAVSLVNAMGHFLSSNGTGVGLSLNISHFIVSNTGVLLEKGSLRVVAIHEDSGQQGFQDPGNISETEFLLLVKAKETAARVLLVNDYNNNSFQSPDANPGKDSYLYAQPMASGPLPFLCNPLQSGGSTFSYNYLYLNVYGVTGAVKLYGDPMVFSWPCGLVGNSFLFSQYYQQYMGLWDCASNYELYIRGSMFPSACNVFHTVVF